MTMRAIGPFNGTLPQPTEMLVAFLLNPKRAAFLKYTQLVPAPEIQFMYFKMDPDESSRLVDLNAYAWGYDDYRPTGKGFTVRGEWIDSSVQRWDFPYTLGEATLRIWKKNGIDPKSLYDHIRSNHAAIHRANRIVDALTGASWGANSSSLADLLGESGVSFDKSSGEEFDGAGMPNPNFQVIKKSFNRVNQRINLSTNNAVTGEEMIAVLPVPVAVKFAESGEIVNYLKQSSSAPQLMEMNYKKWGLPEEYAGFKLVVEDTPRCYINQKADGTVADVTVPSEKGYILNDDTVRFVSRVGALQGAYGGRNFSTVQLYHFNGEARVEAFTEPKHELVEGHVVMEDRPLVVATASGFELTDVLS